MGNFPTAAKLKPPKTKQRGRIYSLDDSVNDAQREGGGDCYTYKASGSICASAAQILTSNVHHVVESLWFMHGLTEFPHLFLLMPP